MGAPLGDVLGAWQKAVSVLDEEERRTIWLHYGVQVKQRELARIYGMSQPAICRRLKRILEKMKREAER